MSRMGWGLVLLAFVATRAFACWLASGGGAPFGDQLNYLIIADNIASGRGMVIDDPKVMANLRAYYPPLYPLLLGLVRMVSPLTPVVLTLINSAFDLASAGLIGWLARSLGVSRAAIPAAWLWLLWPSSIFFSPLAYKEALVCLLMLAGLATLVRFARGDGGRWAAAAGGCAGLMTLTQPALAPLFGLFFVALRSRFPDWPSWWRGAGIAAAAFVAVMLPWWARNALLFGQFVPLTSAGGVAWWIGTQEIGATSWIQPPAWARANGELAFGAAMAGEAWRIIAADPAGYLLRCLAKLPASFLEPSISLRQLQMLDPVNFTKLVDPWKFAPMLAQAIASLAGLVAAIRLRGKVIGRLVAAALVQILLFGIWFEFGERQRYFLVPLLLLALTAWVTRGAKELKRAPSLEAA